MLCVSNLYVKGILNHINLQVASGSICGIFGDSGSGKSTLLKCIKNLDDNWQGSITYNGEKISKYDKNIGYVFQETSLYNHLSVIENLQLANNSLESIHRELNNLGIGKLAHKEVFNLSGGEKQRIGICRTLLLNSKLILMDEPTSALDVDNKKLIYDYMKKIQKEKNITIIMVSHDVENTHIFDQVIRIENGNIVDS